MLSPEEELSETLKFDCMTFKIPAFSTAFGLVVTLTFDLLTPKSNQFIFLSNCTEVGEILTSGF